METIDFGIGAAQRETHLRAYFYRSASFRRASSDRTYLVLGAKGAGKSAIYCMLRELEGEIPLFQSPNLWMSDEPQLRDLWATSSQVAESKVTLWKFYLASLIAKRLEELPEFPEHEKAAFRRFLVRWGLVREVPTKWQALMSLRFSVGFGDYIKTEIPPSTALSATEIDFVLSTAQTWLHQNNRDFWICLDALDEVTLDGENPSIAETLSSDLMRAFGELTRLNRLRFKLFFRTDLYNALTYVNKDHFSATKLELKWSIEDLAILLGHRLKPESFGGENIRYTDARKWIDEVFAWDPSACPNFDTLYARLTDGNGDVLPRDLIQFCLYARDAQISSNIQGVSPAPEGKLIGAAAISAAIDETARSKQNDFLQVFRNFNATFDQLRGHSTSKFDRAGLIQALSISDPIDAQLKIADLVRVGAIAIRDQKAVNHSDCFEIPYLYARALKLGDIT